MGSTDNVRGSKMNLDSVESPVKSKVSPLLKGDSAEPKKWTKGSSLKQIVTALLANLGNINTGLVFGYTAVSLPKLEKIGSRILIDKTQASWIASISTIGTLCGCIVAGYLTDKLGRKKTLMILQLPGIIGWLMVGFSKSVQWIYVGRVLVGLNSSLSAPSTVYTSEVSQSHVRGVLTSFSTVAMSIGIVLEYSLGYVLEWDMLAFINAVVPTIGFFLIFLIPESPSWLISSRKDKNRCRASLKRLRDAECDVDAEVNDLLMFSNTNEPLSFHGKIKLVYQPSIYKPFVIVSVYTLLSQFTGFNVITFNAIDVIKGSGSTTNEYVITIVLGVIRLIFTIIGCVLLRHCGRKTLSYISSIGCGVPMLCFAGYMRQNAVWTANGEAAEMTWLPEACLYLYYACSTIGFMIVPWVLIGEVFPGRIRGMMSGVTWCFAYFTVFLSLRTYPLLEDWLTKPGMLALYGTVSLLFAAFLYLFFPETKGKTLQEIEMLFVKNKTRRPVPSQQ